MMKFIKKTTFLLAGLLLPIISFAQESVPAGAPAKSGKTATEILREVAAIINIIIPIIIGLALLVFVWGVFKYFFSSDAKNRKESIQFITWGIISLFVMVAIWGFVNMLQKSFLGDADPSSPPTEEIESLKKEPKIEASKQGQGVEGPIGDVIRRIAVIIEAAIPLLILIGVLVVIWGIFRYAFSNDAKGKETARTIILWGVIGLTVMAFVWSLVVILQNTVFEKNDPSAIGEAGKAVEKLKSNPVQPAAGGVQGWQGINRTIAEATNIVSDAIPLLVSLAILLFLWGVFKYVSSDSAKIKSEGIAMMSWGVVVLLIIGSVWGFVNLFAESSNISLESQPNVGKDDVSPGELIIK